MAIGVCLSVNVDRQAFYTRILREKNLTLHLLPVIAIHDGQHSGADGNYVLVDCYGIVFYQRHAVTGCRIIHIIVAPNTTTLGTMAIVRHASQLRRRSLSTTICGGIRNLLKLRYIVLLRLVHHGVIIIQTALRMSCIVGILLLQECQSRRAGATGRLRRRSGRLFAALNTCLNGCLTL